MTPPASDATSSQALRAALLATAKPATLVAGDPPLPTIPELLESSPNLQRLCESYHRARLTMVRRSRRQRIGIALLVSAIAIAAFFLENARLVDARLVSNLVITVAAASCAGLAVMAMLWMRDDRRLRSTQGERLLRAVAFNCELPADRLEALRVGRVESSRVFFDCYHAWRAEHTSLRDSFPLLLGRRNA